MPLTQFQLHTVRSMYNKMNFNYEPEPCDIPEIFFNINCYGSHVLQAKKRENSNDVIKNRDVVETMTFINLKCIKKK